MNLVLFHHGSQALLIDDEVIYYYLMDAIISVLLGHSYFASLSIWLLMCGYLK